MPPSTRRSRPAGRRRRPSDQHQNDPVDRRGSAVVAVGDRRQDRVTGSKRRRQGRNELRDHRLQRAALGDPERTLARRLQQQRAAGLRISLYTPNGVLVLQEAPADHPHHQGVFAGAELDGNDLWNADRSACPAIARNCLESLPISVRAPAKAALRSAMTCAGRPRGNELLAERRSVVLGDAGECTVAEWRSTFSHLHKATRFGQTKESGLGVRVPPHWETRFGGRIRDGHDRRGEAGCFDQSSPWLSIEGAAGSEARAGVVLVPTSEPCPWFTRDYGVHIYNPARHRTIDLEPGAEVTWSFRVLAYDGARTIRDIDRLSRPLKRRAQNDGTNAERASDAEVEAACARGARPRSTERAPTCIRVRRPGASLSLGCRLTKSLRPAQSTRPVSGRFRGEAGERKAASRRRVRLQDPHAFQRLRLLRDRLCDAVAGAVHLRGSRTSGLDIDFMPNHEVSLRFPASMEALQAYDAVIISDAPADPSCSIRTRWPASGELTGLKLICDYVRDGGGFAMIGGWMAFGGFHGKAHYAYTPLAGLLPVKISPDDDRMETPEGVYPEMLDPKHPLLAGHRPRLARLPWLQQFGQRAARCFSSSGRRRIRSWWSTRSARAASPASPPTSCPTGARRDSRPGRHTCRSGNGFFGG